MPAGRCAACNANRAWSRPSEAVFSLLRLTGYSAKLNRSYLRRATSPRAALSGDFPALGRVRASQWAPSDLALWKVERYAEVHPSRMESVMAKEYKTVADASPPEIGDRKSSKGFPWNISATVAVLTVFTFAVAAAGEWAYYLGLGALDFLSLASPADYTSGALLWLPLALAAVVVGFVSGRITSLITVGSRRPTDEEIAQGSRRWKGYLIHMSILVALFSMAWIMHERTGDRFVMFWLLPGGECWILFSRWFSRHPHVRSWGLASTWHQLLIYGPLVAAFIIARGHDEAVLDMAVPSGEYRIVHSTGVVEDDVQLLRATSKGVLVLRVPSRDVSFFNYESFNRIDRIGSSE